MAKKKEPGYDNQPKVEVTDSVKTHKHDVFTIVERNGQCVIAFTDKIISQRTFNSVQEAIDYIESKPWELMINVPCAVMDILFNMKPNQEQPK